MRYAALVLTLSLAGSCFGEKVCFRSTGEAAAQSGVRAADGFWLDAIRRDVFSGVSWGTVRSCVRPELPAVLLQVAAPAKVSAPAEVTSKAHVEGTPDASSAQPAKACVVAGSLVRVVKAEPTVRLEFAGIALASGTVGDRVRVRVAAEAASDERFVIGVVRATGLLEMEER